MLEQTIEYTENGTFCLQTGPRFPGICSEELVDLEN